MEIGQKYRDKLEQMKTYCEYVFTKVNSEPIRGKLKLKERRDLNKLIRKHKDTTERLFKIKPDTEQQESQMVLLVEHIMGYLTCVENSIRN
jgi:hypothetical protein